MSANVQSTRVAPGQRIGGVVIEAALGEGLLGPTFRARTEAGAPKVLKIVEREDLVFLLQSPYRRKASPAHPSVIGIDDVGFDGGSGFILRAHVNAPSLVSHLRGPKRADSLVGLLAIRDTLQVLAATGAIHGDLGPDNIFLLGSGVIVTDFGLAEVVRRLDPQGLVRYVEGTAPGHGLSPRLLRPPSWDRGKAIRSSDDLYSLGALLVHLLGGDAALLSGRSPADPIPGPFPDALRAATAGLLDGGFADARAALAAWEQLDLEALAARVRSLARESRPAMPGVRAAALAAAPAGPDNGGDDGERADAGSGTPLAAAVFEPAAPEPSAEPAEPPAPGSWRREVTVGLEAGLVLSPPPEVPEAPSEVASSAPERGEAPAAASLPEPPGAPVEARATEPSEAEPPLPGSSAPPAEARFDLSEEMFRDVGIQSVEPGPAPFAPAEEVPGSGPVLGPAEAVLSFEASGTDEPQLAFEPEQEEASRPTAGTADAGSAPPEVGTVLPFDSSTDLGADLDLAFEEPDAPAPSAPAPPAVPAAAHPAGPDLFAVEDLEAIAEAAVEAPAAPVASPAAWDSAPPPAAPSGAGDEPFGAVGDLFGAEEFVATPWAPSGESAGALPAEASGGPEPWAAEAPPGFPAEDGAPGPPEAAPVEPAPDDLFGDEEFVATPDAPFGGPPGATPGGPWSAEGVGPSPAPDDPFASGGDLFADLGDGTPEGAPGAPPASSFRSARTISDEPYGGGTDPFGAQPDSFGMPAAEPAPASGMDPFAAPPGPELPASDPFAGGAADPFAAAAPPGAYGAPGADPFAGGAADPFAGGAADPFAAASPGGYAAQGTDPFAGGAADPFAAPPSGYGDPGADPFGGAPPGFAAAPTGFSPAMPDPFGVPAEDPYGAPPQAPMGAVPPDAFAPPADPFAGSDPFAGVDLGVPGAEAGAPPPADLMQFAAGIPPAAGALGGPDFDHIDLVPEEPEAAPPPAASGKVTGPFASMATVHDEEPALDILPATGAVPPAPVKKASEPEALSPEEALKLLDFESGHRKKSGRTGKKAGTESAKVPAAGAAKAPAARAAAADAHGSGTPKEGVAPPAPAKKGGAPSPTPAPAAPAGDEVNDFGVVISGVGVAKKKEKAAKILSEVQKISMDDALALTKKPVITVLKDVSEAEANRVRDLFQAEGLTARVTSRSRRGKKE